MINSRSGIDLLAFKVILFLTLILVIHPQCMMGDTGIQKASRQPPPKGAIESSIRKGTVSYTHLTLPTIYSV